MKQDLQNQHPARNQKPFHALATETSLDRHSRKCAVCHHPEREAIEEAFIHWRSPDCIAHDFDLDDRRVLYRHAHATGLYDQRRRNYLFTIENILERGEEFDLTAAAYIKAVRAYACLCDTVRWSEPVTRVLHEYNVHTDSNGQDVPANIACGTGSQPVRSSSSLPDALQDYPAPTASAVVGATLGSPATAQQASQLGKRTPGIPGTEGSPSAALRTPPVHRSENSTRKPEPASSATSLDANKQFLAAAIPLLGATPQTVAQLKRAGLSSLAALASRHLRAPGKVEHRTPPSASCSEPSSSGASLAPQTSTLKPLTSRTSNRHTPELETRVSHRKQRSEVVSNRHKIAK